jgi:methionyl-tRNA formyltransferase
MARAVVFAYHDVGARCLPVLLRHGVEVPLVVTHHDAPGENIWFASVERLALERGLEVAAPADPGSPELLRRLQAVAPDFIFSFYYRHMLPPAVLATAARGAYNLHGSLLPKYRGRVPINWAIIHGETETGATLHEMTAKPDAGRIVGRKAVPIGPDDTAAQVFARVVDAAEALLEETLPALLDGSATLVPQDLASGSYFGGRKPADGRIDWTKGARQVHDLVRAVAPPYPGAFTRLRGAVLHVHRTKLAPGRTGSAGTLACEGGRVYATTGDGTLEILELAVDGKPVAPAAFCDNIGPGPHPFES